MIEDWAHEALCAEVDPELFFPAQGASTRPAKKLCHSCAVREPCLLEALLRREEYGVWGGMSAHERHGMKPALRQAVIRDLISERRNTRSRPAA